MKKGLKISMILLLLFSIYNEVFAAQKIDYYSIPDILKDSRQDVIGNVAMIHKLRIIEILKPKRTYLGQDEAGNKVVLNFTGRVSVSPEFGKIKRLEVGNVYTIFFRISGISSNGVVQGNMEAIGFPNEIPSSVVKRQKEPDVSRPNISQKQTTEQKESAPEVVAREPEQSKSEVPLEKKAESPPSTRAESKPSMPIEKRGYESKVAEVAKPVVPSSPTERKIEPTPVVPPPPDTIQTKPQVSEPTPPIEKKTDPLQLRKTEPSVTGGRSVARTGGKTAQAGRKTSEAQGGWMDVIVYLLPLIIGACVSGLTYGAKTDVLVNGVNKFDAWVIRKRNGLKSQEGKGKIKRYWAMPILWILNRIIELSEKIQNEAIRCGVKTSAFLYLLGIVIIVTFYAVVLIVSIVIIILVIAFIGWILSLQEGGKAKRIPADYTYPHDDEEKKSKWPWKNKVIVGRENVYEKGFLGDTKVGHVEENIWGEKQIHKEGIIFSDKIGKVETNFWGTAKSIVDKDGKKVGDIKETWTGKKIIVDDDGNEIGEYKDKK